MAVDEFNALLDRFTDLALAEQDIPWAPNPLIRGIDRLVLDYRQGPGKRICGGGNAGTGGLDLRSPGPPQSAAMNPPDW